MKTFFQFRESLGTFRNPILTGEDNRKSAENDRRSAFLNDVEKAKKKARLERIRKKLAAAGIRDDEGDFADDD
jgi:hypothetical protein